MDKFYKKTKNGIICQKTKKWVSRFTKKGTIFAKLREFLIGGSKAQTLKNKQQRLYSPLTALA